MNRYEIDGVPVLFVKSTGPTRAGLMFRVGRADEPLPLAGITHLVEHLALHRHGLLDHHANANVGTTVTHFYTSGTAAEVSAFFDKLCGSLADLPMQRLAVEKEILRTEASGRGGGVNGSLPLWRYGAQGYGLVSYHEFGLNRATAEDLRAWTAENFTRDNAVFWLSGEEIPAELRLSLPAGTRRPLPPPSSALRDTPAYFHAEADGVVMDTLVPRGMAAQIFTAVLERALYRELRLEGGVSYTATTDYSPRGDDMAVLTAYADALTEKQTAALHGFVDVFKHLAKTGVSAEELEVVRVKALESLDHPEFDRARLPAAAIDLLTGHGLRSVDQIADEVRAVTAAEVSQVAEISYANALLQVPRGVSAETIGFAPAPSTSDAAVSGSRHSSRGDDERTLVIGADGISVVAKSGQVLTVRYADCVARLRWPDGATAFIGRDGIVVTVEPTLFRVDDTTLAGLGGALPDSLTVPMPERSPERIPQPLRRGPEPRPARKIEFSILAPLTAVLLWGFITMASAWTPEDGELAEQLLLVMMALVGLGVMRVAILGINRLKLGRW